MNNTKKGDEIQMPYQMLDKEIQCGMTYKYSVIKMRYEYMVLSCVIVKNIIQTENFICKEQHIITFTGNNQSKQIHSNKK